jgi:ADP-ribose pyrophosphatase YjhB (NUDIX family)
MGKNEMAIPQTKVQFRPKPRGLIQSMHMEADYIRWLRARVGHDPVILTASVALIPGNSDTFLLIKRSDGSWGLPGGMLEVGETAIDAVKREVFEELGVNPRIERFQGTYTNHPFMTYPNGDVAHVILFVFVCSILGDAVASSDATACDYRKLKLVSKTIPYVYEDYKTNRVGIIR